MQINKSNYSTIAADRGCLIFLILICSLPLLGDFFRKYLIQSCTLWLLSPLVIFPFRSRVIKASLTNEGRRNSKFLILTIIISLSIFIVMHNGHIRDLVGNKFIAGYTSWGPHDYDLDPRDGIIPIGGGWSTESVWGRLILNIIYCSIIVLGIIIPYFTNKMIQKEIETWEAKIKEYK